MDTKHPQVQYKGSVTRHQLLGRVVELDNILYGPLQFKAISTEAWLIRCSKMTKSGVAVRCIMA